ncbi:ABC transporter substrate-binding protein [Streptomyces sp. NBC_01767]|uniref:ABC transporter substrate-binding protein n=1 Tax=Streptomyces sp. NBC_01767 TaxID=2975937 RepID=UPI00224DAB93|nr:ABC transporter substrate-binding protein [Streptomyces sp. NBC_01767]MCX4394489.1 ABC transporter substrate-binding protein [Streptomyces sp. NBC_01767]
MRSIRLRILAILAVLVIAGVVAWQLLPSDEVKKDPVAVGTTDVVTSLDPAGAYDAGSWAMYSNIYQSLMTFKSGAVVPEPDAAESCGFIGQKLQTYQCKLRDDLTFSNGRKITAEDVKYSIERMIRIKTDVGPWVLFPSLKNVVADGRTVTFNLTSRDATFPQKLATGAGSIVDRESYPADKLRKGNTVDGSGPYALKSYRSGEIAELIPNTRYKGAVKKEGVPVTVHYYQKSSDLLAAWNAKQLDVTHRELPPATLAELNPGDPDLRVTEADSAEIRNLVFNVRPGTPLADKKVRQAIASIIDRGPLVSNIYKSTVEPLYSLIPQGYIGHSTPFFDAYPTPDPARAKQLLKDAGVQTPVKVDFGYRGGDETQAKEAEEIRRQLEEDGLFKIELHAVEWTKFQKEYAAGKYDAYTIGWLPDYPDPDTFSQPLVGRNNSLHNGYSSKKVDSLIGSTLQYGDRGRTAADFKELQAQVGEDVPLVPLWQKKDYVVSTTDVSGSQYLSDGTGIWRLWELKRI